MCGMNFKCAVAFLPRPLLHGRGFYFHEFLVKTLLPEKAFYD